MSNDQESQNLTAREAARVSYLARLDSRLGKNVESRIDGKSFAKLPYYGTNWGIDSWIDVQANRSRSRADDINSTPSPSPGPNLNSDVALDSSHPAPSISIMARKRRVYDGNQSIIDDEQYLSGDSLLLSESNGYLSHFGDYIIGEDEENEDEDDEDGEEDDNDNDNDNDNHDLDYSTMDSSTTSLYRTHRYPNSSLPSGSADIDLGTSLSTLISTNTKSAAKSKSSAMSTESAYARRMGSRVSMRSVRIISESEMKKSSSASSSNSHTPNSVNNVSSSVSSLEPASGTNQPTPKRSKRRSQKSHNNNMSSPPKVVSLDISTITLAAASISLVAGISFSAGYAIGKRSGMLRVAG